MLRPGIVVLVAALLAAVIVDKKVTGMSCKNRQNQDVDWFIVYKIPRLTAHSDEHIRKGVGMLYMDAVNPSWIKLDQSVNDTDQPVAYTMGQTYQRKAAVSVHYTDQRPDGNWTAVYGHTKGSFAFNSSAGFWLIHSVPRFPPLNDSYSYPPSGTIYGQNFFCISLNFDSLKQIESILFYNYPWIYQYYIDDTINSQFPILSAILRSAPGNHVPAAPWNKRVQLQTIGGLQISSFAKFVNFSQDIYYDWVAPSLESGLYTETWQNEGQNLPSNCSGKYSVNNIQNITFPADIRYSEHQDHSKWAVGTAAGKNWICIGDINRQETQKLRAGGTHCFQHQQVWAAYYNGVASVEKCTGGGDGGNGSSVVAVSLVLVVLCLCLLTLV